MCKKIMRCVVVFALVLALVCSSTVAYAAEARRIVEKTEQKDHNDIQIERIEDNKLRIVENGETSIIEVNQVSPAVTEIRLIGPDNETLVLTTDRERQTITSSQTGKTISI